MNFLLDTCTFLWLLLDDPALPGTVKEKLRNPENEVYLSAISAWEVVLKQKTGRLHLSPHPAEYMKKERERHRILPLPLEESCLTHLERLPAVHRDPFDRILICQAMEHGLTILTPDPAITRYPIKTMWG